jgi:calcium/proton exchanger cax
MMWVAIPLTRNSLYAASSSTAFGASQASALLTLYSATLYHNQLEVVQASILGSVLVNLLLILGMSILAGSFCQQDQVHNTTEAHALASLLGVSVFSLVIPVSVLPCIEVMI